MKTSYIIILLLILTSNLYPARPDTSTSPSNADFKKIDVRGFFIYDYYRHDTEVSPADFYNDLAAHRQDSKVGFYLDLRDNFNAGWQSMPYLALLTAFIGVGLSETGHSSGFYYTALGAVALTFPLFWLSEWSLMRAVKAYNDLPQVTSRSPDKMPLDAKPYSFVIARYSF